MIDGLIEKRKCYFAFIQLLGTRSVSERLRQLLFILADTQGHHETSDILVERTIRYEQVATIVGATSQWVTQSLKNCRLKIS